MSARCYRDPGDKSGFTHSKWPSVSSLQKAVFVSINFRRSALIIDQHVSIILSAPDDRDSSQSHYTERNTVKMMNISLTSRRRRSDRMHLPSQNDPLSQHPRALLSTSPSTTGSKKMRKQQRRSFRLSFSVRYLNQFLGTVCVFSALVILFQMNIMFRYYDTYLSRSRRSGVIFRWSARSTDNNSFHRRL